MKPKSFLTILREFASFAVARLLPMLAARSLRARAKQRRRVMRGNPKNPTALR